LIHRAASHEHFAEIRLIDDSRFPRGRRPFRRVRLFHIVHEIKADGLFRARVEGRENCRFPIALDPRRLLKSGVAREVDHVFRAFRVAAILGRDRDLFDPILETFERFIVPLGDFLADRVEIIRGPKALIHGESGRACEGSAFDESPAIDRAHKQKF
jgi:hypothetical protein